MTVVDASNQTALQRLATAHQALAKVPGLTAGEVGQALGMSGPAVRGLLGKSINRFALAATERDPKPQEFSDQDMIKALRDAAEQIGEDTLLTFTTYQKLRNDSGERMPSAAAIHKRFGSWRKARAAAGVGVPRKVSTRHYERRWTEDEMTMLVADAMLEMRGGSFRDYEKWAKGRPDVPAQVRITSDRSWTELAADAYKEFAAGGRRNEQYLAVLDSLFEQRTQQLL